ncbi:MAG TPA: 5'-nucleotidase C-terminal domain-containing protein [Thermoanaerobaculia bacterium]|nr:5'-nucleotidase C-terminal domain-containing protein [Thermoanaerobaculia bacterium]
MLRSFPALALALLVVLPVAAAPPENSETTVTLLHFADYHSHAQAFYSEGGDDQGGIARAIGYLKREKQRGALIFSGGDMMNAGSPAWSDKYRCAEWSWLNGIVDAMAYGNHDGDYGTAAFVACRRGVSYPILSANVFDAGGHAVFATHTPAARARGNVRYAVFRQNGVRIGVFAVAGPDFDVLVKKENRPAAGAIFGPAVKAAREMVHALRDVEKVDAVVLIGHEQRDDDAALARAVPGIDVILGTHSHLKEELSQIPGTRTWIISPFQYLTYISRVTLRFRGRELIDVSGGLVRVNGSVTPDAAIARKVAAMEQVLESDPGYRALFETIGTAATPLAVEGQLSRDAPLPDLALDVMRGATGAHFALSTASSFRQSIASGPITMEALRAALPYDNEILVFEMTGARVAQILDHSVTRAGSDFFAQVSGVRFSIDVFHEVSYLSIVKDPRDPAAGFENIDKAKLYRVATTDYLARVAPGYRELFAGLTPEMTGLHLREELRKYLAAQSPVSAKRDGRIADEK